MPIAINGSGTITGISAGGLPDGVITTDDIAANAVTIAKLGSNEASGLCKAWVNFNGTSTVAIRASYNVSSITDNGVGDYTVNFATAMVDANYSIALASGTSGIGNNGRVCQPVRTAPVASSARVLTQDFAGNGFDSDYTFVSIHR
jgi:hypothetical protein